MARPVVTRATVYGTRQRRATMATRLAMINNRMNAIGTDTTEHPPGLGPMPISYSPDHSKSRRYLAF